MGGPPAGSPNGDASPDSSAQAKLDASPKDDAWVSLTAKGVHVLTRSLAIRRVAVTILLLSISLISEQKPAASGAAAARELPAIMKQKVVAGSTPVGTKVQAKLVAATLVDGTVIPQGAVFSGEVTESVAKSATGPSRLAIRMDSVQWKKGSAPIKVYLTAWYYPIKVAANQDPSFGPLGPPAGKTRAGTGTYTDPDSPASQPFTRHSSGNIPDILPDAPSSGIAEHRALMKDVASNRGADGAIAITSTHQNIKLDKQTTYVLAAGDLMPAK